VGIMYDLAATFSMCVGVRFRSTREFKMPIPVNGGTTYV